MDLVIPLIEIKERIIEFFDAGVDRPTLRISEPAQVVFYMELTRHRGLR